MVILNGTDMQGLLTTTIQPDNLVSDTILLERGIINPLGPSKPGLLNKLTLVLSTENIDTWGVYLHYNNHFTSSQLKTYGSEILRVSVKDKRLFRSSYEVEPTDVIFLDQETDPCFNVQDKYKSDNVNIWSCLEDYIASKVNCTLPWRSKHDIMDLPLCTNHLGYMQFMQTFSETMFFETDNFTQTANCIPSCERVEYSVKLFTTYQGLDMNVTNYLGVNHGFQNAWQVDFFFGKDRFTKREQYYTYDFQNLLADFGGYLGLLLGYSLLGFYDTLTELLQNIFDKCNKRKS